MDDWFSLWIDDEKIIIEGSISLTAERGFLAEVFTFAATRRFG